jgi:hypothetical protein
MGMTAPPALQLGDQYLGLVGLLNRELVMLERLAFKLTEAQLLARADEARFLGAILDEIDAVESDLATFEIARAMLVADIAQALGLATDDLSLRDLVAYAPEIAVEPLTGLLPRLVAGVAELAEIRRAGSDVIAVRLAGLEHTLERIELGRYGRDGYDERGEATVPRAGVVRFNYSA